MEASGCSCGFCSSDITIVESHIFKSVILVVLKMLNPFLIEINPRSECSSNFIAWLETIIDKRKKKVHLENTIVTDFIMSKAKTGDVRQAAIEYIYDILQKPGNDVLIRYIDHAELKRNTIKPVGLSSDVLNVTLLRLLHDVHIDPKSRKEYEDMKLLHLIMCRRVFHQSPLNTLLQLEDYEWSNTVNKIKQCTQQNKFLKLIIDDLSMTKKKYIKFVLLLYKRITRLHVGYEPFHPKSMKCIHSALRHRDFIKKCTIVVCCYCMEILTHFGTKKRPSSFGFFFDSEKLQHRCYRDDSDALLMITLFDPTNQTSLSVGYCHSSRITVCHGNRACFDVADGETMMCLSCQGGMTLKMLHKDTCLTMGEPPCETCNVHLRKNPNLIQLLTQEEDTEKQQEIDLLEKRKKEKENTRRAIFRWSMRKEEEKHSFKTLIR